MLLNEPVSVLMPVCNERDVIRHVIDEWARDVFAHLPQGSELLFDDCSNDGTTGIIEQMRAPYPFLRVNQAARDGFDRSAKRLYQMARCPLVFFTDSDGQYVAADFWKIARHIGNFDMVHGYKRGRQDPLYRLAASWSFNRMVRWMFGSRGHDVNSAFRLVRVSLVRAVLPDVDLVPMLPNSELYIRAEKRGFRILDVPITHRKREFGKSRGLPLRSFVRHAWKAFQGLRQLRRQVHLDRRGPSVGETGAETAVAKAAAGRML